MRTSLLQSLLAVGFVGGCMGTGAVAYRGEVTTPQLYVVSPGVQVVADYDEPIFYSDNYYWRNDSGVWYRSHAYTGGWARFDAAPVQVRSIQQPSMYVHYHGEANGNVNVRDHRESMPAQPEVRDHRESMPPPPPPQPEVRDHRDERGQGEHRDERGQGEHRDERQQDHEQRKDDRNEDHRDHKDKHDQ